MVFNFKLSLFKTNLLCFTKFSFVKNGGGAFLLLLCLGYFCSSAIGQDNCSAPPCNNLKVEIVRLENVSPNCSAGAANCSIDKFHQIAYTVYLRSKKTVSNNDPLLPFSLDYSMLDIKVNLQNLPQFSHIDVAATESCFQNGVGAKWFGYNNGANKVIFKPTDKSVKISFANLEPGSTQCGGTGPGNVGNVITFTYGTPPGTHCYGDLPGFPYKCAYVELFTVIVNAYPGEQSGMQFELPPSLERSRYLSFSGVECNIAHITTNATGMNGAINVPVPLPPHYTGTANQNVQASLLPPVTNPDGSKDFPIQIKNNGTGSVTVNYLEFMVKALLNNVTEPIGYSNAIMRLTDGGIDPMSGSSIKYLHYNITPVPGLVLMPNETAILGNIKVLPPIPGNLSWGAIFAFQDSGPNPGAKSRIETSNGCTTLNASSISSQTDNIGDAFCSDPNIHFKVEAVSSTCSQTTVNVGFTAAHPPANITLSKIEFELEFDWTGTGISISGVNYPSGWPGTAFCNDYGCFGAPLHQCYEVVPSGSKIFKYCYSTDDAHAPTFSLDAQNNFAKMEILFNTSGPEKIENVKIRKVAITYVSNNPINPCVPMIDPIIGFPLDPAAFVKGEVKTETNEGVDEVTLTMSTAEFSAKILGMNPCTSGACNNVDCSKHMLSDNMGKYGFCEVCSDCDLMKIIPEKNDNPLNGVTTYDLVLISKHILVIEPLGSPFKIIAADANKSNSVTTFDIVEIRKLILGIYQEFPANKSWRFVDKSHTFQNPANPFLNGFPEGINCVASPSTGIDFTAIKIGDVNNSVTPNRPANRPVATLSWPTAAAVSGSVITIPITYTSTEPMDAIQLGLRFDPAQMELVGPSKGDIESYLPGNFNLLDSKEGAIKTLWLPMSDFSEKIMPNTVLFYLTFKILSDLPDNVLPLWLDDQLLDAAAWKPDGEEYAIQAEPALVSRDKINAPARDFEAYILPNPTSGSSVLAIKTTATGKARVAIFDAFGKQVYFRELTLAAGRQDVSLEEVALLPAGVYAWKVYTQDSEAQGHLIKL